MQKQWKTDLKIFLAFLLPAIALFFLVDIFTLTYRGDGRVSGNGNLGVFFVFPAIPVYLCMLVYVYKASRSYFRHRKKLAAMPLILLPLLSASLYGEYRFIQSLVNHLGGGPDNPDSVIYNWPWLNQYTNTLFFNFFTFTIGILFVIMLGLGVELWRRRKMKIS